MLINYGFEIALELFQPTTVITTMDVHPSRWRDRAGESALEVSQPIAVLTYADEFGNTCRQLTAQPGALTLKLTGTMRDSGLPDHINPSAQQVPVPELPSEARPFLRGSRYCETDLLSAFAWANFGAIPGGWAKVQAICDYVNRHLIFSYPNARPTRTAAQALEERSGVCRDFTHLAVTLCRCLNIPARYCNGYLGDIGVAPDPAPMDFNAWFEAYLDGRWYTFDARHNTPRVGRILLARGRDAADIPMITSYGPHQLRTFKVITEEVAGVPASMAA